MPLLSFAHVLRANVAASSSRQFMFQVSCATQEPPVLVSLQDTPHPWFDVSDSRTNSGWIAHIDLRFHLLICVSHQISPSLLSRDTCMVSEDS